MGLRFALPEDSAALLDIYNEYIGTSVTFELTLPTEAEFAGRIREFSAFYPYLVWEEAGQILGYAYAHRLWTRAAYQWNAELSVYLRRTCTGRGLGRRLYGALLELLRLQGVLTVYGIITMPNDASQALHRAMGFEKLTVYPRAGYKCGAWRDVAWFKKDLAAHLPEPSAPRSVRELPPAAVEAILRAAEN